MQGYLREAILTKILPATNHKGARAKAKCSLGYVALGYSYTGNAKDEQLRAVNALMRKLNLAHNPYTIHSAETREGYVHIIEFTGEYHG